MKTRSWIFLFAGIALACAAGWLLLRLAGGGTSAEIWSDGVLYQMVDLSRNQTIVVESAYGSNTVIVRDGEISVAEATCPDGVCIAHGPARAGDPIVCLPNRLVIQQADGAADSTDATAG